MTIYRCYFLGGDCKIKGVEVIECSTDAAALQEGERILATSEYPMIEIWDKARRIGAVRHSEDHVRTITPSEGADTDPSWLQS